VDTVEKSGECYSPVDCWVDFLTKHVILKLGLIFGHHSFRGSPEADHSLGMREERTMAGGSPFWHSFHFCLSKNISKLLEEGKEPNSGTWRGGVLDFILFIYKPLLLP
jgi:hypothetical protein